MKSAAPARSEYLGTVDLKIPSRAEWVAVARLAVAAIANRLAFSIEEIEDLKLAIAEACTHFIQQTSGDAPITVTCDVSSDFVRMTVAGGPPGEDAREGRPLARQDDPRIEGLGIFLIESIMDEVQYTRDPALGSRLVMTKRLAP